MLKNKISKRKGGAEKLRERKRQALEADATKCVKINELFAGRPAKDFSEDVRAGLTAEVRPLIYIIDQWVRQTFNDTRRLLHCFVSNSYDIPAVIGHLTDLYK